MIEKNRDIIRYSVSIPTDMRIKLKIKAVELNITQPQLLAKCIEFYLNNHK